MNPAKALILAGTILVGSGLFLLLGGKLPSFGHLPGDLIYHKSNITIYLPITTSLLISALLSLFLYFSRR